MNEGQIGQVWVNIGATEASSAIVVGPGGKAVHSRLIINIAVSKTSQSTLSHT